MISISLKDIEMIKFLVKNGANLNSIDIYVILKTLIKNILLE